jgi:hypothetical protein
MPTAARTDAFEPVHDAHAIEQVVLSLQFDRPLDDSAIERVQAASAPFAEALPGRSEVRSFGVAFGLQGLSPMVQNPTSSPDGFVRTRTAPNGAVEKELRVDRNGTLFRTTVYTRWANVWDEARRYFSVILGAVDDGAALNSYSLQYVDKFIWEGDIANCRPERLLRPNSAFVCPHVFLAKDLWHSHSGYFERSDEATKRLYVINVECGDEVVETTTRRVVRITTAITDLLNQPSFGATRVPVGEGAAYLDDKMNTIHNLLKNVIGRIVNDEICQRIDLATP